MIPGGKPDMMPRKRVARTVSQRVIQPEVEHVETVATVWWSSEDDTYPRCPKCHEPIDYCLGHGVIG